MTTKITTIDTSKYESVNSLEWRTGKCYFSSWYNHNYYYSEELDDVIFEVCDDNDCYEYYRMLNGGTREYLGDNYYYSIFDGEGRIAEVVKTEYL